MKFLRTILPFLPLCILMTIANPTWAQVQVPALDEMPKQPTSKTEVQVVPRGSVVISGVTLICKGTETLLKVEGDYESFQWNTGSTERIIKVREEGIYEVTVKTKGGCTISSSVNVQVRHCTK